MTRFEDSLTRTPLPEPSLPDFKRALRRELVEAQQLQRVRRWRTACLAASAASVALVALLGLFVARPELAGRLNAGLTGETSAATALSVERDREFLATLYAESAVPIEVTEVTGERVLAVRDFTLSDGKQLTVYTELGDGGESLIARSARVTANTF